MAVRRRRGGTRSVVGGRNASHWALALLWQWREEIEVDSSAIRRAAKRAAHSTVPGLAAQGFAAPASAPNIGSRGETAASALGCMRRVQVLCFLLQRGSAYQFTMTGLRHCQQSIQHRVTFILLPYTFRRSVVRRRHQIPRHSHAHSKDRVDRVLEMLIGVRKCFELSHGLIDLIIVLVHGERVALHPKLLVREHESFLAGAAEQSKEPKSAKRVSENSTKDADNGTAGVQRTSLTPPQLSSFFLPVPPAITCEGRRPTSRLPSMMLCNMSPRCFRCFRYLSRNNT